MRDADIDLARLQTRRDAAIARDQTRAYVWQGLQAAALALMGLALAGWLQGLLLPAGSVGLLLASALALLAAGQLLEVHEARLDADVEEVDRAMERLKQGGAP